MIDDQIKNLIEKTLLEKRINDPNFIRYSFFEVRVKYNVPEEDTDRFLKLARDKILEKDESYKVFFTGMKYKYKNEDKVVAENELMIAFKEEREECCK